MKAFLAILLIFLVGCSESESEAPADAGPRESVFDDLTGTINRAEAVEDVIFDSAAERRRQIEEAAQ
jgi:hypothetical protein